MSDTIKSRLASALGRRDEAPNVALAEEICENRDHEAVRRLVGIVDTGVKPAQNDGIKVLCEIGTRDPSLLSPYGAHLLRWIQSGNNRLVWGAMTALAALAKVDPDLAGRNLKAILDAADKGSVIAKDQAIQILATLVESPGYADEAAGVLLDRLQFAAVNQLPMYAERAASVLRKEDIDQFQTVIMVRLQEDLPQSKRNGLMKALAKLPS